jgi:aryl-alcohol dehydrogenase-like predicted oxidoreductase
MEYRTLGHSGLRVSAICLGAMTFGGATDEATADRIIAHAHESGVNFIDTADMYNGRRSEEIVGRAIKPHRSSWIVATKIGQPTGKAPNQQGLSRVYVTRGVDESLRRLGLETIDILFLHRDDRGTALEQSMRSIGELIRAGKIRHFALSNYRAWRLAEVCRTCTDIGIDPPIASQPSYNLLNREAEFEHLPACHHYGLGIVSYSPLARGVLSAKYLPNSPPPPDSRVARKDERMLATEWRPENLRIAQEIARYAEERQVTACQFALAWVLNNSLITSAIAGPRTFDQWAEYIPALDYKFTGEDEAFVNNLVRPGHNSSPGYTDPAYPVEGRIRRR